ncbi:MAG: alkaline phosphatase family protein [Janthinobacterium lividum]
MTRKKMLKSTCSVLGIIAALSNTTSAVAQSAPSSPLTTQQRIALLQQKVKYVFVIFNENQSFDHHFGTFPGANGLLSAPSGNCSPV